MATQNLIKICPTCWTDFLAERDRQQCCSRSCAQRRRYGDVTTRFWTKVNKTDGCWLWTGALDTSKYGILLIHGTPRTAHRVAWELINGPIPDGMCVCHHCDVRHCVNPAHLWLGTNADNVADKLRKGRGASTLTPDDVRAIRSSTASDRELGLLFGIQTQNITLIRTRKAWKHVP